MPQIGIIDDDERYFRKRCEFTCTNVHCKYISWK